LLKSLLGGKPKGYWNDIENRKKFFLNFAAELGFDPFDAKNWENITKAQICERRVRIFPSLSSPSNSSYNISG